MAKTSRSTRRFRRGKKEFIWATTLFNGSAAGVAAATLPLVVVASSDWSRGGGGIESGAVLQGMRGWFSLAPLVSSTGTFGSCFLAIVKEDVNSLVPGPNYNIATPYNDEAGILFTAGATYSIGAAAPAAATPWTVVLPPTEQLEVKAKRKLTTDDVVNLWFTTSTAATDWVLTGVIRALIALP